MSEGGASSGGAAVYYGEKAAELATVLVFQRIFPGFLIFLWLVASLCHQQIFYQSASFPQTPSLAH